MDDSIRTRRALIVGAGSMVAAAALGARPAAAQSADAFRPASHSEDGWLNQRPGKHRIFIDAATPNGAGEAILYSNNLFNANKSAYAGTDADLAIVVCLRHFATPFAFTDPMWEKYGKVMGAMVNFNDPKTKAAPEKNLYRNSPEFGLTLPNLGATIDAVTARGAYFAVCDTATHFLASQMATPMKMTANDIYKDLSTNLIPNSRLVSAGVMAVTRAQEHGYSLLYAG